MLLIVIYGLLAYVISDKKGEERNGYFDFGTSFNKR